MDIPVFVTKYGEQFIWLVGLLAIIVSIHTKVSKPIRGMQEDTALLLWNTLTREHDCFVQQGYCPQADKCRLVAMHARYRARGLNHLADDFEKDIIELPDNPPRGEQHARR